MKDGINESAIVELDGAEVKGFHVDRVDGINLGKEL